MKDKYLAKLKNKENLTIDLQNEITIDLTFDDELNAYKGYSKEINTYVGIWTIKTLFRIINNEVKGVNVI